MYLYERVYGRQGKNIALEPSDRGRPKRRRRHGEASQQPSVASTALAADAAHVHQLLVLLDARSLQTSVLLQEIVLISSDRRQLGWRWQQIRTLVLQLLRLE